MSTPKDSGSTLVFILVIGVAHSSPNDNEKLLHAKHSARPWSYNPKSQIHNSAPTHFYLFPCPHSCNLESSLELLSRNHSKLENSSALLMRIMSKPVWKIEKRTGLEIRQVQFSSLLYHWYLRTLAESLNVSRAQFFLEIK